MDALGMQYSMWGTLFIPQPIPLTHPITVIHSHDAPGTHHKIVLPYADVSKVHCIIVYIPLTPFLINSSHGHTALNRLLLDYGEEHPLKQSNVLHVGGHELRLVVSGLIGEMCDTSLFFHGDDRVRLLIRCCVCFNVMIKPLRMYPCGHSVCAGCLSLQARACVKCGKCGRGVGRVEEDAVMRNVIGNFLEMYPCFKRDWVQVSALSDGLGRCEECGVERNGFRCREEQKHIRCSNCNKLFALREEKKNQCCAVCGVYMCNLYTGKCTVFLPRLMQLRHRSGQARIEKNIMKNNFIQAEIYSNLLFAQKKTVIDVFKQVLRQGQKGVFLYSRALDTKIKINEEVVTCDGCWRSVWFQMLIYYFKLHGGLVAKRPDCHWGFNCRSMQHNIEHAKKYNHLVEQSKES